LQDIINNKDSVTGAFLSGHASIAVPEHRRKPKDFITIKKAQEFNLKKINVNIPLGVFTCITGVSGSGKSTLILEILYKALARKLYSSGETPGRHEGITGIEKIDKAINVDQAPLGRTPRSNPATYTGIFSFIRNLFAQIPTRG